MVLVLYIFITPIHILTIFYGFGTIYFHYAHPYSDDFFIVLVQYIFITPIHILMILVLYIFITPIHILTIFDRFGKIYFHYAHL